MTNEIKTTAEAVEDGHQRARKQAVFGYHLGAKLALSGAVH